MRSDGLLGRAVEFVRYSGRDFNGIFDALDSGEFDCVASGTTITGSRALKAAFCDPYLISGQALAVDTARLPEVRSVDDLEGLTVGVQQGNTSQPIANRLMAEGKVARVRVYAYGSIRTALRDLTTARCDAFMKLGPVLDELVRRAARCRGRPARHHHREDRDRRAHHRRRAAGPDQRRTSPTRGERNFAVDPATLDRFATAGPERHVIGIDQTEIATGRARRCARH